MSAFRITLGTVAGWMQTPAQVKLLANLQLPEITIGPFTRMPQAALSGTVIHEAPEIETTFMVEYHSNQGFEYLLKELSDFAINAGRAAMLRVVILPLCEGDTSYMVQRLAKTAKEFGVSMIIEIDMSAPSFHSGAEPDQLLSYDREGIRMVCEEVQSGLDSIGFDIAVKFLPAYPHDIEYNVFMCKQFGVKEIVATGSYPHGVYFNEESGRRVIEARDQSRTVVQSLGSINGLPLFPIALANVAAYSRIIESHHLPIRVTAQGGIDDGHKVWQFRQAGATKFLIGDSVEVRKNALIFTNIDNTLAELQRIHR